MTNARRRARARGVNVAGAILTTLIVGFISYLLASSATLVEVPEKASAVKVKKAYLSWFYDPTIESVPAGIHEISGRSEVYSFDTSKPRKLSFRVALSGNFANKWIPGVEGEPPLLVKGHVVLALDQRSVDALLAQRKNIDIEQIILDALKDPLSEARSSREDLKAYSEKVLPALRGKLPAGIENAIQSLEIEEVTKDSGSAVSSIETVATKLETLKRLPLGVFLSYFWLTGIVAVIFILTYALIPELFIILSGVIVFIPLAIANACGGGLGSGFDFDGPDINIDF